MRIGTLPLTSEAEALTVASPICSSSAAAVRSLGVGLPLVQGKQASPPRFGDELETQRNRHDSSIRDNALLGKHRSNLPSFV
jgi:hypothetical protein